MRGNSTPPDTELRCECCGEPATTFDADGVPLCEGDYQHLLEHWRREFDPFPTPPDEANG